MNTLFKNATILQGSNILEGCLGVSDNMIAFVGNIPDGFVPTRVIDCDRNLLMPGLVNAHTHIPMTLFRSVADDMDLFTWLNDKILPLEAKLDAEAAYWGGMLAIAEMIRGGVTCVNDMYMFSDTIFSLMNQTGMRGVICRCLVDDEIEERIEQATKLHDMCSSTTRIKASVGVHGEYMCSRKTIEAAGNTASKLGILFHTHASETFSEHEQCRARHGLTPIALLNDMGILGNKTLLAHCVHVSVEDIALIAAQHATIVHCPQSNLKLGSGIAPLPVMLANNCSVALGTDGAASNNNLDMFEEMRLAATLHKGLTLSPTTVKASQALSLATVTGARALGFNAGLLETGRLADIIMIDSHVPHMLPRNNLLSHVVYSCGAADVRLTMIDGNIVYENGEYYTIDYERLVAKIEQLIEQ